MDFVNSAFESSPMPIKNGLSSDNADDFINDKITQLFSISFTKTSDEVYLSVCVLLSKVTCPSLVRSIVWEKFPSINTFILRLLHFYLNRYEQEQNISRMMDLHPSPLLQLAVLLITKLYSIDIEEPNPILIMSMHELDPHPNHKCTMTEEPEQLRVDVVQKSFRDHGHLLCKILEVRGFSSPLIDRIDVELVQALALLLTYRDIFNMQKQDHNNTLNTDDNQLQIPDIVFERMIKRSDYLSNNGESYREKGLSSSPLQPKHNSHLPTQDESVVEHGSPSANFIASELIQRIVASSSDLIDRDQVTVRNPDQASDDDFAEFLHIAMVVLETVMMRSTTPITACTDDHCQPSSLIVERPIMSRRLCINMIQFSLGAEKVFTIYGEKNDIAHGNKDLLFYDKRRFVLLTLTFIQQEILFASRATNDVASKSSQSSKSNFNLREMFLACDDDRIIEEISKLLIVGLTDRGIHAAVDKDSDQVLLDPLDHQIRFSTLELLVFIMDGCGSINWLLRPIPKLSGALNKVPSSFPLLCLIFRLTAGELQIAADGIVDIFVFKYVDLKDDKPPLLRAFSNELISIGDGCRTIVTCIQICLIVLQEMARLQDELDDSLENRRNDVVSKFQTLLVPQSILHLKESLDIALKAAATILTNDVNLWSNLLFGAMQQTQNIPDSPYCHTALLEECFLACGRLQEYAET